MSFTYLKYFPLIIVIIILFGFFSFYFYRKSSQWFSDYFNRKYTWTSHASFLFYGLFIVLCLFSLLDLRGKTIKLKTQDTELKTVILLDTSASMLVEDVRPNRFKKALFMARHYIKNAGKQQIAVIVFSDSYKTIVPFTSDIDLLDARLKSLESINLSGGGSGIWQAVNEASAYISANQNGDNNGNILLFTDGEDNAGFIERRIPNYISVAAIGVGTQTGGVVPQYDRQGSFIGNLKFNGEEVVSKFDKTGLDKFGASLSHYKLFTSSSYSLPTQDILNFFRTTKSQGTSESNIQPVLGDQVVIVAILFFVLSILFKYSKLLTTLALVIGINFHSVQAQNKNQKEIVRLEEKLMKGSVSAQEKLKLAQYYMEAKKNKESTILYKENLPLQIDEKESAAHFNFSTALAQSGDKVAAINNLNNLLRYEKSKTKPNEELVKSIQSNLLHITKQMQEDQKSEKNKKDQENDQKDQQENKNQDQGSQGEEKDKKTNEQPKQEEKKEKEKQNSKPENQQQQEQQQNKKLEEDQREALYEQLKSDDKELQEKLIDKETRQRNLGGDKKEW
jgi:Ca-activated chloride channel family protein